jgi:hypothetical protein
MLHPLLLAVVRKVMKFLLNKGMKEILRLRVNCTRLEYTAGRSSGKGQRNLSV